MKSDQTKLQSLASPNPVLWLFATLGMLLAPLLGTWLGGRVPDPIFQVPPPIRIFEGSEGFSPVACAFAVMAIAEGDWSDALSWIIGALLCGFFWETWNHYSLAKWFYTVPGLNAWHVFALPILGYSGYLPFGLECLLAVELLLGPERRPTP
jgi:hypothetical protein